MYQIKSHRREKNERKIVLFGITRGEKKTNKHKKEISVLSVRIDWMGKKSENLV